jgi:formylglycine-generating enzyme
MKKLFSLGFAMALFIISSCSGGSKSGELEGVQGRPKATGEADPFGMVFIPQGSYNMGGNDQDVAWAQTSVTKTVTVDPFWMDETEITNNEYRQFVFWVRDSIMRKMLGDQLPDDYLISQDRDGNPIDPPMINWETKIDTRDEEVNQVLSDLYLNQQERFYNKKEIDTRKLMYEYFWIDLKQAAKKSNRYNFDTKKYEGFIVNNQGEKVEIKDRSSFVIRDVVNVYPDTLVWIADFTYSFNEPYTTMYFWHPSYDNYPVVGVSWKQATAFCIWRSMLLNASLRAGGNPGVHDYRLPLESEWEYAARGGLDNSMYPWGGYYTRNKDGCFLANFKPLRGNYADDGGVTTVKVGTYQPNEYGLYDMAGNVSEWTSSAYDESSYMFTHDLNPDYRYNARPDDPPVMKRKVIRGGSWKDIGYYMQNATRSYEYQDTSKSYIGFRCVRPVMGGV